MPPRRHRRRKTRDALIDAALALTTEGRGFASLSLREITRAAGVVPTAFYRHFEDMDELGLEVVERSSEVLRTLMHEARNAELAPEHLVQRSVDAFFDFVQQQPQLFLFLVRERHGGSTAVRDALSTVIQLFVADLATDLARMPPLRHISTPDLQMLAALITDTVFGAVPDALNTHSNNQQSAVRMRVAKQLRVIVLGIGQWRSDEFLPAN